MDGPLREFLGAYGRVRTPAREVRRRAHNRQLLLEVDLGDPYSVALHVLRHQDGTYSHGATLRKEVSEEISGAWLHHVAGDVLARHQAQAFTLQGAPLRCILALCSLSAERNHSIGEAPTLTYLPVSIAYLI